MTNQTESLITRFAKCAERLKDTDAPKLPSDISIEDTPAGMIVMLWAGGDRCRDYTDPELWIINDRLALPVFVCWAMGVAGWHTENTGLHFTVATVHQLETDGSGAYGAFQTYTLPGTSPDWKWFGDITPKRSHPETVAQLLESICDGLGV